MSETLIPIPGRLHSVATEGHVAGADEIYDDSRSMLQTDVNTSIEDSVASEASTRASADTTLQTNIDTEATTRASADSTLQTNINAEASSRQSADNTLTASLNSEITRAEAAENTLTDSLNQEITRAKTAENTNAEDIDTIESKIPSQATASNQLADKSFVNSSISTATADFKGTYSSVSDLDSISANANDYAFVVTTDTEGNTLYNRYKYSDSTWTFEYSLNNSSYTATQWAAIQSGITSTLVSKLSGLPSETYSKSEIDAMKAPVYSTSTKGITFAAASAFEYDATNKKIILSV